MGYHPRIESRKLATFVTTRTKRSELWFANNRPVEQAALSSLAKITTRYGVKLYAFALEGSHYHSVAHFPRMNRRDFARDFNSGLSKAVAHLTPHYTGGKLWQRRYSGEMIAGDDDIEHQFFYTVLQPVKDGLVSKISEYPFYNCFHDAVCGYARKFKCVNYTKYHAALRYNPRVSISDYTEVYYLRFDRLPGYEHLTQHEYRVLMEKKLEVYRLQIIKEREAQGKYNFVGRTGLLQTIPGQLAKNPKESDENSHRPRVLSKCPRRRAVAKRWYFACLEAFRKASRRFLAGDLTVIFPPGCYRPPVWLQVMPEGAFSVL